MNTTDPNATKAEPCADAKKTKSKGERAFDWAVYGGIAGVGTFIATVPLTYLFRHTAVGERYYFGIVNGLHKAVEKVAPQLMSKKIAEDAVMTTALMMGGNAMLLPVGYAEKHKVTTVTGLNTILGDNTPPDQIEAQPQQTWGSLVKARLTAWGAVFAAIFGASSLFPKSFTTFEHEFAERACKALGKPTEVMKEGRMVPSRSFLLGKISALDVFATAAAAVLLYVAGHSFARKREEKKHHTARHHSALADLPDAVEVDALMKHEGPETTLKGERILDGKTQESSLALANQL